LGKYNLVSARHLTIGVSLFISIVSLILAVERFQGLGF